jgi:hypothetical protein
MSKKQRTVLALGLLAALLAASAYYAKKMSQEKIIILQPSAPSADGTQTQPVEVAVAPPPLLPSVTQSPPLPEVKKECVMLPSYQEARSELGLIVNERELREKFRKKFAAKLEIQRKQKGLPLSLGVDATVAEKNGIVFNNCKPSCRGLVHQVFVSGIIKNKFVEVLGQDGKLKKLPLHASGLEILTIDELNKKGVPFRSWTVPMNNGPWFLKGKNIYVGLDIDGVWLKVTDKGQWSVVPTEKNVPRLIEVDPLKVLGCVNDDLCLTSLKEKRNFKAPRACEELN